MGNACSSKVNSMRLFLLPLFVFSIWGGYAQKLSTEKDKFIKQLSKEVESESFAHFVKRDLASFISSKLNSQEYNEFVETCNLLLKESYLSEDMVHYIHSVYHAKSNQFPSNFYTQWHSFLNDYLIKSDKSEAKNFLTFSEGLYKYRSIYKDNGHRWLIEGGVLNWSYKKTLKLSVKNTDLKCMVFQGGPRDSIVVYNTSGVFDLQKKTWKARGGNMTWEKVGFPKNETFAKVKGYSVFADESIIRVDTVELTTPYFEKPILGRLEDKTVFNLKEGESSPIFNSFEKRLLIENIRKHINYDGGFTLEGASFIGRGVEGNLAKLTFSYNDRTLFELKALNFLMTPQQIIARNADVLMYYDNGDSLSTKDAIVYWNEERKELKITAAKKGVNPIPFVDSYFKVFVNAPILSWRLNTPFPMYTFEKGTSQEQRFAHVESWDYFDEKIFDQFSGIGNINPLLEIAELSILEDTLILPVGQVASQLRKTISQCKSQLIDISSLGFIRYNSKSEYVIVEQKLLNYALSKMGQKDYDELRFVTDLRPKQLNYSEAEIEKDKYLQMLAQQYQEISMRRKSTPCYAYINLDQNEFFLNEVEQVTLSSNQHTFVYPDSTYVRLLKNRDMVFSGWLVSGKFVAHNIESAFNYDDFTIAIDSSNMAYLSVNPLSARDGTRPIDMVSNFNRFNGKLFIDFSDSKSGRGIGNGSYPYLEVKDSLKIFYNSPDIVNGAYDSTRFFYTLNPFVLDSLDSFDEKTLRMEGLLKSDGIFPDLDVPLKIMNDYSFGFVVEAPPEGYPFYETESLYENKIVLSNNGLQGAGIIDFMGSQAVSRKLTFLPDSTIGLAQFYNEKDTVDIEFPQVVSEISEISFKPRTKVLTVKSYRDNLISLFEDECYMTGELTLSENGITGKGKLNLLDASMEAVDFVFSSSEIFSDSSSFNLINRFAKAGENPLAIQSNGLKSHVSFKTRMGEFNSKGTKRIKFPSNNYYCQMDKFLWQMDGESIDFEKKKEVETRFETNAGIVQNNFFSMDETQDSLQFKSIRAQYDLKNETINCFRVDFLEIGDAYIFPKGNSLKIRKNAVMDTLFNAHIVANRITKLHEFSDVTLTVKGRYEFYGNGFYSYFDRDSSVTKIDIGSIYFDKIQTIASTEITEDKKIRLSSKFDYFGDFIVSSKNDGVICDGYTRMNHSCDFDKSWMKFSDTIYANNVKIPISKNPKSKSGKDLASGFLWKDHGVKDSLLIYPTFLSVKQGNSDAFLFSAHGKVSYDYLKKTFELIDYNTDDNYSYSKLSLVLDENTCSLKGRGKIDLGINLEPVVFESFGDIQYNSDQKSTNLTLTSKMTIPLPKNIGDYMGKSFHQSDSLKEYTFSKATQERLTDIFSIIADSEVKGEKLFKDYDEDKLNKTPGFLQSTFLFPELSLESYVNMEVDAEGPISGLKSKYSKIPVFSMNDEIVLKRLPMKMLVLQSYSEESNQGFELLFNDASGKNKYSFKYLKNKKNGKLIIESTDMGLMRLITNIKEDKRKSKNFSFTDADEGKMFELMYLKKI